MKGEEKRMTQGIFTQKEFIAIRDVFVQIQAQKDDMVAREIVEKCNIIIEVMESLSQQKSFTLCERFIQR